VGLGKGCKTTGRGGWMHAPKLRKGLKGGNPGEGGLTEGREVDRGCNIIRKK